MKRSLTPKARRAVLEAADVAEFTPGIAPETLPDLMDRGTFTRTGWIAPTNLSRDGWLRAGAAIQAIERATPWLWADWWQHTARHLMADWQGPALHTLENYVSVARAFPHSRRRELLSFAHHAELIGLSLKQQDELLDWCVATRASVKGLRQERNRRLAPIREEPPPAQPFRIEPPLPPTPLLPVAPVVELPAEASPSPVSPKPPVLESAVEVRLCLPAELHARAMLRAEHAGQLLKNWIMQLIDQAVT